MTPFITTHNGLLCLPSFPQTSLSLRGKAGEDPQNHIMSFHLWCLSNNIVDYSIRLRLSQRTLMVLRPSGTLSCLMLLTLTSPHSLQCSFNTLSYSSTMTREWRSYYLVVRPQLPISQIIYMNGVIVVACVRSS